MYKRVNRKDIEVSFKFENDTDQIEPRVLFPGQERVKKAFELALNTDKEGYNIYVAGSEGIGKITYTLKAFKEKARNKKTPEDICYYHNFEEPQNPLLLLLPAGTGKKLKVDLERIIDRLKEGVVKQFESKEFEDEQVRIVKKFEEDRKKIIDELNRKAAKHGLAVVFTPAGVQLLPIIEGKVIPNFMEIPQIKDIFEARVSEFEPEFREYLRKLRDIDYKLQDALMELKKRVSKFVVENIFYKYEEKYSEIKEASKFLNYIKERFIENLEIFIRWKIFENEPLMRRAIERELNVFRLNVVVDNSKINGARVILEEIPTFRTLFGYVSYKAEMGILYADHMSIVAGNLHKARGGYLILRAFDILKNPVLWDMIKRTISHKKIYMTDTLFESVFPFQVGIRPEPVPFEVKIAIVGTPFTYSLLSIYDFEFNRLFKVKAEFNPVINLNEEVKREFGHIVSNIVKTENLKHVSKEGLSELLKFSVYKASHRKKINVIFSHITDILREADVLSKQEKISSEDIKTVIEEKKFRHNLVEEKIQELIKEGILIFDIDGEKVGQVNGISVYETGDYSFGKPSRITASAYIGEKGIINIEREVELSGPIHSKGVMILSGYIGFKYGKITPLALSCSITFEQSYGEVEGDSASAAELIAVLSAISGIKVKQSIALTGSIDQHGNIQPVGGIKEKVEGFFKTCKVLGLNGKQGVVVPSRNFDNLLLEDDVLEAIETGKFHVYIVDTIDDIIELMTDKKAEEFHRAVTDVLEEFYSKVMQHPKK